jgi:Flp pilus assembly protein TadG
LDDRTNKLRPASRPTACFFSFLKNDVATALSLPEFVRCERANIAVIFAIAMIPTIYLLGMTMDYTDAVRRQSQLDAATDAAVIAAVTPAMMTQTNTAAAAQATMVFNATANQLPGLAAPPNLTVNVTNIGLVRSATVSYTAASVNNFPILLGSAAWPIRGSSSSGASGSPNINFFLLLDTSPSMAIAGTPAGISTMVNATSSSQGGCAFACHETHPSSDNLGNPGGEDNYALARNLNVTLRIDLMTQAVANLMTTAQQMETKNNNVYKVALYSFDYSYNTVYAPSGLPTANLSAAASAAIQNISLLQVYDNNCLTVSNCNSDTDTDFSSALQQLNTTMPAPGGGTTVANDVPQEVVFLVTDGVEDKISSSCSQVTVAVASGTRCQQPFDTTWCTTVKNRGIRIAVLYTEYLQLPTNSWYNQYIAPFNSPSSSTGQIATNLQACASPGLFYDVQSGGDITAALNNLFQLVVQTAAHLTQ